MNSLGDTILLYRGLEIPPGNSVDLDSLGTDYSQDPFSALPFTGAYPGKLRFDRSLFVEKGRLYLIVTDPLELEQKADARDLVISLKSNRQFSEVREVRLDEVEKILKWEGRRESIREKYNDNVRNPEYINEVNRLSRELAQNVFSDYF